MRGTERLAEGSTHATTSDIRAAFARAFTPGGLKALGRGKLRLRDDFDNPFRSIDREPPTAVIVAEMPNSFASFISIQLEIWDLGNRCDYRVLHTGVTGPVGVSASRREARQRAARFAAEV
jgi:hypothetical protein